MTHAEPTKRGTHAAGHDDAQRFAERRRTKQNARAARRKRNRARDFRAK